MHTKKTNNTNKLIQISYHSILTKIQKLQNFKKKKKKNFFLYRPVRPVPAGIARNWPVRPVRPVFFPVRNRGVECTGLLASTVYSGHTGRYGTELTTLHRTTQEQKKTSDEVYIWQKKFSKLQATYDCQKNKTQIYTCGFLYWLFSFNNTFCLIYKYKYIYILNIFF